MSEQREGGLPGPPPVSTKQATPTVQSVPNSAGSGSVSQAFGTAYGTVVWPSLPGLPAAVGVGPVPPGTTVAAPSLPGLAAAAPPAPVGSVPPAAPGMNASEGGDDARGNEMDVDKSAKARRKRGTKKDEVSGGPNERDLMVVLRSACDACHRMKRKCDGLQPCNRCRRRSRPCGYSYKQKSGPPKGSKRKLIAADEDLLENRQSRPKLLPLAMWPTDGGEEDGTHEPGANTSAGGNTKSDAAAGTNGINRLLAVGGHNQVQPQRRTPGLPGISLPPEGSGSNGVGAAAAAAAVAAASAANAGQKKGSPTPRQPSAHRSAAGSSPRSPDDTSGSGSTITAQNTAASLPMGAAQLSLEARAGAYRKAQEAAAAGMAAAAAYVTANNPYAEEEEAAEAAAIEKLKNQKQTEVLRRAATSQSSEPAASSADAPSPAETAAAAAAAAVMTSAPAHALGATSVKALAPAMLFTPPPGHGPPASGPMISPAAAAAAAGQSHIVSGLQKQSTGGVSPASNAPEAPRGMPNPIGIPMPYHPQYGVYQPYPQSLYAAYLAQYQLQQGMTPYEGASTAYDGMPQYTIPQTAAAGGYGAVAGHAQGQQLNAGATVPASPGAGQQLSVAAAAAALAAATQNAAAGDAASAAAKGVPKESEDAKQLAVETLLGLKNSHGSKGEAPMDEASVHAMAAVTAAAAAAARATSSGGNNGDAASAAAAAAQAVAVAQAVAAAGAVPPATKRSPQPAPAEAEASSSVVTTADVSVKETGNGERAQTPDTATEATSIPDDKEGSSPKVENGTHSGNTSGASDAQKTAETKDTPAKSETDPVTDGGKALLDSSAPTTTQSDAVAERATTGAEAWAPVHGGPEEKPAEKSVSTSHSTEAEATPVASCVEGPSQAEPAATHAEAVQTKKVKEDEATAEQGPRSKPGPTDATKTPAATEVGSSV